MLLRLFAVLAGWALAEIASLMALGRAIGVAPALVWVLVAAALGGLFVRSQGRAQASRVQAALVQGQIPAGPLLDGMALMIAGLLLIVPGLFSDALAVALLLPQARRRFLWTLITRLLGGTRASAGDRTAGWETVIEGESRRVRD